MWATLWAAAEPAAALSLLAAQHLHLIGNNFGVPAILPVLIGPLSSLQLTFDIDLSTFAQVLPSDLPEAPEHHHSEPLGALLLFTSLFVLP